LGYKEGYRPIQSSPALELGTGIHDALDWHYSGKGHPVERFEIWADGRIKDIGSQWDDDVKKFQDIKELGISMLESYIAHYGMEDEFEVIATEKTLSRPIPIPATGNPSKCHLVARLDGIVRDNASGKLYSLEHKTFSRFSMSQLEIDHQFTAQVWLGQQLVESMGLDEPIMGVIYNGLRKQAAGPRVKLKLFERHKLHRTKRHIDVLLHRAYWQYREMNRPSVPIYPQPNAIKCGQCDFKEVCTEYHRGGDWNFLLRERFTKRGE